MIKGSVRKPFTVLVAVIAVIVVGFVALRGMTTDLLPEISLPYLVVITSYPGASPERVESEVSKPMENALGTVSGVKNVYSVSSENYSLTELEFEDGTDMDSATVKVSSAVSEAAGMLPDSCGTPSIMEISMNMVATMYLAVEKDGCDIYALSDYVTNTLQPALERQDGVASVSDIGLVKSTVQVELNSEKIADLNRKILEKTSDELASARVKLDDSQKKADEAEAALKEQESAFGATLSSGIFSQIDGKVTEAAVSLKEKINSLTDTLTTAKETWDSLSSEIKAAAQGAASDAESAKAAAQAKVTAAQKTFDDAQKVLEDASRAIQSSAEVTQEMQQAFDLAKKALADAQTDLDAAKAELTAAIAAASSASEKASQILQNDGLSQEISSLITHLKALSDGMDGSSLSGLMSAVSRLSALIPQIQSAMQSLGLSDSSGGTGTAITGVQTQLASLSAVMDQVPAILDMLQTSYAQLTQGQLEASLAFSSAASQLTAVQAQLKEARTQYDTAYESALKNANADSFLTASAISQLIYAQNFSMPAGYINDRNGHSWLLKIGDEYADSEALSEALLCTIPSVGTVRLSDVADVTLVDNAGESYARLNGHDAVVLSVYKGSAAGTNSVSTKVNAAIAALEAQDAGLHVVSLMDQGNYITMIVQDILKSMLLGAALAIVILALFLRDIKPTVIVAVSIPLSVFFALVLMYFSGFSLNIMTLSGLALGIGMLVDNSIVVLENIFRLRSRGLPAPRAAVQGTMQVAGAIASSTLTTVCVFLPMVFTSGTVRELLVPMALSVSFCLLASLVVAMTVVPASAATVLKNMKPKKSVAYEKVLDRYEKALRWCLKHKAVVLATVAGACAACVVYLISMGIVVLPTMTGDNLQVTVTTPEEDSREESYQAAGQVMDIIRGIDGVKDVGIMDSASTAGFFSSFAGDTGTYGSYLCYVKPEDVTSGSIYALKDAIEEKTKDLDCTVEASTGSMSDMQTLSSGGLTVNIYGNDLKTLEKISKDVVEMVKSQEGFGKVSDGTEETEKTLHLIIDKDKAMSCNLTVAQIYAQISARLKTSVDAATITVDGTNVDVKVKDATNMLTKENLLEMEFTPSETLTAASSASGTGSLFSGSTSADDTESPADDSASETGTHVLSEFATIEETDALSSVSRKNLKRYLTVTAETKDGYSTSLLSRELQKKLDAYSVPQGYSVEMEGETSQISDMLSQMIKLLGLALLFIYLVMVAQFQSLLSPFIIMFTIPLAFTGGMLGLILAGEQLSMLSLMGFLILVGTVVNNGIVFVDYANQLRLGGMERIDALVATGRTRMRPILMTALTTILAMMQLIFGSGMGSQMGRGMAIVIAGGLFYATFMTLFIVPVIYDILFKRKPLTVDIGEDINDAPDDAAQFIEDMKSKDNSGTEESGTDVR